MHQESFNANNLTMLERATKRWKYLMVSSTATLLSGHKQ
jgi:hypothetical protein